MPRAPASTPARAAATESEAAAAASPSSSMYDEEFEDAPIHQGLISKKRKSRREALRYFDTADRRKEWARPYWLGTGLFLLLFAFWLLDSLKDPLFARLVDGKIERHQPTAKLCSVASTLVLVCLMEYLANLRQRQAADERARETPREEVLDPGMWKSMPMLPHGAEDPRRSAGGVDDTVSITVFYQVGIPYVAAFAAIAVLVARFEEVEDGLEEGFDAWYVLAYVLYATIESFGSIAVATFWSFTNCTLSLEHAERYYGPIIALAQLGAIGGSTLVARDRWRVPSLLVVVSLVIVLQMLVMGSYHRRFQPTNPLANAAASAASKADDDRSLMTWQDHNATTTKPFWSGLYLIFNHYYVILILGVSCLYEISLTCLDYQMKLLGYARFESGDGEGSEMSFAEFMGRYGQVVNLTSLVFSSLVFPTLIRRLGLRVTLRIFPSLLLLATIVAYGALPGNLAVLFVCLSVLKAMTYSVHDPSKEILYIPTSNAVKFRAKFWIDVVGERVSKAVGSAFNTLSGSVERSVRVGGLPSVASSAGLWFVCYYVGIEFDKLVRTGRIVGLEHGLDPSTYHRVPGKEEEQPSGDEDPADLEIRCGGGGEDGSVSTLGLGDREEEDALAHPRPLVVRI